MSFEKPVPNAEDKSAEQVKLDNLWRKFNFSGRSPRVGTPVMERLRTTCESYLNTKFNPRVSNIPGSDDLQRRLHNEIAIMVVGQARSGMTPKRAEEITEFASYLVYGISLESAEDLYVQANQSKFE